MSPEVQNEMIEIFYRRLMRHKIINNIKVDKFFCLICDEGTDSSNKEFLSVVLRQVDDDFVVKEYFLGFYQLNNISSSHLASAIKDSLLRIEISLDNCRRQDYDETINILGKKIRLAATLKKDNPKAIEIHFLAH